jgi:hypothetical protein
MRAVLQLGSLHKLPPKWQPKPDETAASHPFYYALSFRIAGVPAVEYTLLQSELHAARAASPPAESAGGSAADSDGNADETSNPKIGWAVTRRQ